MRKLAIAVCLAATTMFAVGQGTLQFDTFMTALPGSPAIDAPVTMDGAGVEGPDYVGQLFVSAAGAGSYAAVGNPVAFLSGAGAGYILAGGTAVPGLAADTSVDVIMRAWATASGADWATASTNPNGIIGESAPVTSITLGGGGSPPSVPARLTGLQGFEVALVPEPSAFALGLLGLAALALRRRK